MFLLRAGIWETNDVFFIPHAYNFILGSQASGSEISNLCLEKMLPARQTKARISIIIILADVFWTVNARTLTTRRALTFELKHELPTQPCHTSHTIVASLRP
jgi:hypothetical protein